MAELSFASLATSFGGNTLGLSKHIPTGEALRFVLVGGGNTLFGLVDTFFFTWLFVHANPGHAALMTSAATLLSTVLNITVSFLTYKWFVFRSRGKGWHEYLRSYAVYGPSLLLSTVAAGPLAAVLARWLPQARFAPYVAQAVIVGVAIVPQFLGHKKFTFKQKVSPIEVAASTEESV